MIAVKMMKSPISCLRPCFLKAKVLAKKDVHFSTIITTLPIDVQKLLSLSQGKKLLNKNVYAFCARKRTFDGIL